MGIAGWQLLFFSFFTVLSLSVVPKVELERRDLSLFFTFVSAPTVVARNLEGIWHLGELDFITVFLQYFLDCLNL